jgi:hypothetical protein
VDQGQPPGGDGVTGPDRQLAEAGVPDLLGQVSRLGDLADGLLDGDLPDAGGADRASGS